MNSETFVDFINLESVKDIPLPYKKASTKLSNSLFMHCDFLLRGNIQYYSRPIKNMLILGLAAFKASQRNFIALRNRQYLDEYIDLYEDNLDVIDSKLHYLKNMRLPYANGINDSKLVTATVNQIRILESTRSLLGEVYSLQKKHETNAYLNEFEKSQSLALRRKLRIAYCNDKVIELAESLESIKDEDEISSALIDMNDYNNFIYINLFHYILHKNDMNVACIGLGSTVEDGNDPRIKKSTLQSLHKIENIYEIAISQLYGQIDMVRVKETCTNNQSVRDKYLKHLNELSDYHKDLEEQIKATMEDIDKLMQYN